MAKRLSMKGIKCLNYQKRKKSFLIGLSFLALMLLCAFGRYSIDASALELTGGNALVLNSGTITTDVQTRNGTKSHSDLIFDFPGTESFVYGLSFDYSSTAIPDTNYLLSFDVTYISSFGSAGGSNYTGHFRYDGLESQTMSKVFESCVDNHNTPITNGGITQYIGEGQVTCSYIFFAHSDSYTSFTSRNDSRIWYGISSTNNRIIVSPGFVRGISWNGLTQDDRDWLESVLPSGTSTADIESAIESAREEEKQEYEDQADETEDTASDESSAAQSTATSLLSVVGQFIGVLTSAQPTNCNLNGNLIPHLPLGNLNLCQNSPPPAITVLGSLVLIAFVVPLAYNMVKRMLALIGSFQT